MYPSPQVIVSSLRSGVVNGSTSCTESFFSLCMKKLAMWKTTLCGACMNLFLTVAQHWSNKLHYYNSM